MKKAVLALFVILCLFASCLKDYKVFVKAEENVIYVPTDFPTIQEAIDNASSGCTIFVYKNEYYEHIIINKSITLIGEDRDFTIINGNKTGNVVSIMANYVSIKNFTIKGSGTSDNSAIYVERSSDSILSSNKIIENYDGISLHSSSSNLVSSNFVSSNVNDGISLHSSGGNLIWGNIIFNNSYGASLYSSSNNVVSGNTISSNTYRGIYLSDSSSNTVYDNNFNNTAQVWSDSTNFWDYDGEGNYWIDYSGQDLNGDGIGDFPYLIIEENTQDNYPLMGLFYYFDVFFEGKTYNVTIISNSTISNFKFELGSETGNRIIRYNANQSSLAGFSRIAIPTELMEYPYVVLVDNEELLVTLLNVTDEARVGLYFTYYNKNCSITIISSKALHLYYELLAEYSQLQGNFSMLNKTYYELLGSYNLLNETFYGFISDYEKLQENLYALNETYYNLLTNLGSLEKDFYDLNLTFYDLQTMYDGLQENLYILNETFYGLLGSFSVLLGNYSALQESFNAVNVSYNEHLLDYSGQIQNIRSLMYIFAATAAIFIIITVYLSRNSYARLKEKKASS